MNRKPQVAWFTICIALLIFNRANTQTLSMQKLEVEDGLSSNFINNITQDSRGFIWFGTSYGLNRFDGTKFSAYMNEPGNPIINGNDINRVKANLHDHQIWVSTRWCGINVFDCQTEKFESFKHEPDNEHSLSSNNVSDIFITTQGKVWVSTSDNGFNLYNKEANQFKHFNKNVIPGLPSNNIECVFEDTNGDLYIGHANDGLTILSSVDNKLRNYRHTNNDNTSIINNSVNCIFIDMNHNIWIGTAGGLCLFDSYSGTFRHFRNKGNVPQTLTSSPINHITQTSDKKIWIGTISDLCSFEMNNPDDLFNGKIKIYSTQIKNIHTGLSNPSVLSIFEDNSQNLWIGSNGGGARFLSSIPPFFHSWKAASIPDSQNGLSDKDACSICVDHEGKIWVGTDGGGINVYNNGVNTKVYRKESGKVVSDTYLCALTDSNGNLWFGSYWGNISIYNSKEKVFTLYKTEYDSATVNCLYEDKDYNIIIGTNKGLEFYNLKTKQKQIFNDKNSNLPNCHIKAISQDTSGRLWIGTRERGLYVYTPINRSFTHVPIPDMSCSNTIQDIFRDSKGRMWVATANGLIVFPDSKLSKFQIYTTKNGLSCNYIRAIQEDNIGNIWISTNFGISCMKEPECVFLNYNYIDGVLIGSFMTGASAKAPDGSIYFGSQNGVCFFNSQYKFSNIQLPSVVFTEFDIHEQFYRMRENEGGPSLSENNITLNYNQNSFSVYFNIMNYALYGQIEYLYKMEGISDIWYNLENTNHITFHNIPYKKYKLLVKARLKNYPWPEHYSTLEITVTPPFWLSWWAQCIYYCLILLVILWIIISYKRRIKLRNKLIIKEEHAKHQQELNDERLRFYTNITHELCTPLTLILGPLEDFQNDPTLSYEQTKKLSFIQQSAKRLLNLVTQILEFRKIETQNKKLCVGFGDISEIIQEVGLKYKELNRNQDVTLFTSIELEETMLYFDPEIVTIILDNLLSNAFKYTSSGSITLALRTITENDIEYTEIEVKDTGCGISEKNIPQIFERYFQSNESINRSGTGIGLALVDNLVNLHQGTILVNSRLNEGSSFRVRFVNVNTYPNALHVDVEKKNNHGKLINKPIVLIVEDDLDIRDYIQTSLSEFYEVLVADNGLKGAQIALNNIPDIIISDIIMPLKSGIDLCNELKSDIQTSHIPIILLTAKDSLVDKTEGYKVGADSYITKPFSATLLRSRMVNLLESRRKIADLISSNISFKQAIVKESLNKIDNDFLNNFTCIIEEKLKDELFDITYVLNQLNMSHSSLYRKIKALTGISINEFIRKIKMRKAEELLLTGKYNISEIAYQIGFSSISYFRKCFRDEFHASPSEYFKKMRKKYDD